MQVSYSWINLLRSVYSRDEPLTVVDEGDLDKALEEPLRPITIRDLLRHTAGLTYSEDIVGREEVAKFMLN